MKSVDPLIPIPAIVKAEESAAELEAQLIVLSKRVGVRDRQTLEDDVKRGDLLAKLKPLTDHGLWKPLLKRIGIGKTWADMLIELAKVPPVELCDCASTREAMIRVGIKKEKPQNDLPPGTNPASPVAEPEEDDDDTMPGSFEWNPELCDKCNRMTQGKRSLTPNCGNCKTAKEEAKVKRKAAGAKPSANGTHKATEPKEPESDAAEPEAGLIDMAEHLVPDSCKEAFQALESFREMDSHCSALQKMLDATSKAPGGEQLATCLQATGNETKTIAKSEALNKLKRDLKSTRPYSVCPYCKGEGKEGCKGCSGNKWVSKMTWDSMEESVKARIKCD